MHIGSVSIEGFRSFGKPFQVRFAKGLSVLVGENGSGKSNVVDALRLLFQEGEFGRLGITSRDFYRPFSKDGKPVGSFKIRAEFADLTEEEQVAFLPWTDPSGKTCLTLDVTNKQNNRGRYQWNVWGGASQASAFERELLDSITCVYLPPLRDAEARLTEGRGSRLARLIRHLSKDDLRRAEQEGKVHPLVERVRDSYRSLAVDKRQPIAQANDLIRNRLTQVLGSVFGQDTTIQFSEVSFDRIVESLRLLFFPSTGEVDLELYRSLEENSLGYNNLIYLATILAELSDVLHEEEYCRVLLIEEPEAHLHPQLQIRLLKYIEGVCDKQAVQAIVTTHSPVLASAVSCEKVIHLSLGSKAGPIAVRIDECGLSQQSRMFIDRWLDATKSTLLFARGVILVEGIAEALLLSVLASRYLRSLRKTSNGNRKSTVDRSRKNGGLVSNPSSLAEAGVSVINMDGIYFRHFMQLFCDLNESGHLSIPIRCSGITDRDPPNKRINSEGNEIDYAPTAEDLLPGTNPALELVEKVNGSHWARLYCSPLKTFEYDLAMQEGNLNVMLEVFGSLWPARSGEVRNWVDKQQSIVWRDEPDKEKAAAALYLLRHIEAPEVGKGLFAQALADKLLDDPRDFCIPDYIKSAVVWACGGDPDAGR